MLIQVARSTTRQAVRRASVRAIAGVTFLGALCSAWQGIFAWDPTSVGLWQRLTAAPSAGALAIAAILPILHEADRRTSGAARVDRVSSRSEWGVLFGTWLAGQFVAIVLFILSTALAIGVGGAARRDVLACAAEGWCLFWPAVAVTGALARAVAGVLAPPIALGCVAGVGLAAVTHSALQLSGTVSTLPGLHTLSIILPPMAVVSVSIQSVWGVEWGTQPLAALALLTGLATGACLAATVGIERLRRV